MEYKSSTSGRKVTLNPNLLLLREFLCVVLLLYPSSGWKNLGDNFASYRAFFSKLIFISMLYKEHVTGFHFVSVHYVSLHCVL